MEGKKVINHEGLTASQLRGPGWDAYETGNLCSAIGVLSAQGRYVCVLVISPSTSRNLSGDCAPRAEERFL